MQLLYFSQFVLSRKVNKTDDFAANRFNRSFDEVVKISNANNSWEAHNESFKPTFETDNPMLKKVKKEWLEDPLEFRK